MSNPIEVPFSEVEAAARELARTHTGDGYWTSTAVPEALATQLGILDQFRHIRTGREGVAFQRFCGQATRAFSKLVAEGVLVKVGRDQLSPVQHRQLSNEAEYYTPEAHQRAVTNHEKHQAAKAEARRRWEVIFDTLTGMHLPPQQAGSWHSELRGHPVTLELSAWERLLGIGDEPYDRLTDGHTHDSASHAGWAAHSGYATHRHNHDGRTEWSRSGS